MGRKSYGTSRPGGTANGGRIKLVPEVVDAICELIAAGSDRTHACLKYDLSPSALARACQRDPEIAEKVAKACAEGAEYYRQQIIEAAASGRERDWKAFSWLAERLHPRVYAEPIKRLEMSGPEGLPLPTGPSVHVLGEGSVRIAREVDVAQLESIVRGETPALPASFEDEEDE